MSDVKSDPWTLLAEAMDAFESWNDLPHVEWTSLRARMNAALAEREAESKVEVEWRQQTPGFNDAFEAYIGTDIGLDVMWFAHDGGYWRWMANCEREVSGHVPTLEEAKAAAVLAAQRLR